jgi:hypothetical protein
MGYRVHSAARERIVKIYLIRNRINGKGYVGQTTGTIKQRWSSHVCAANSRKGCPILSRAIRKYSPQSFSISVLATAHNCEDLNRLEASYIAALRTLTPNGYNVLPAGRTIAQTCQHGIIPVNECNKCRAMWSKAFRLNHPRRWKRVAKEAYHERVRLGRCARCPRRAIRGMVHCAMHAKANCKKSAAYYSLRHPIRVKHWNSVKTHCKYGHAFTPENTRTHKGERYCRSCECIRSRRRRKCG